MNNGDPAPTLYLGDATDISRGDEIRRYALDIRDFALS